MFVSLCVCTLNWDGNLFRCREQNLTPIPHLPMAYNNHNKHQSTCPLTKTHAIIEESEDLCTLKLYTVMAINPWIIHILNMCHTIDEHLKNAKPVCLVYALDFFSWDSYFMVKRTPGLLYFKYELLLQSSIKALFV